MFKAVSFDLWFTLVWEDDEGLNKYTSARINSLYNFFNKYVKISKEDVECIYNYTRYFRMMVSNDKLINIIAKSLGVNLSDDELKTLTRKYIESTYKWKPYVNKEVYDIFPILKNDLGFKIAIVSNTSFSSKAIWHMLKILELDNYVDAVISSSDVGYIKPMIDIFNVLYDVLNIRPNEIIHVGDSYIDDVVGALNAGSLGILYRGLWKFYSKYIPFKGRHLIDTFLDVPIIDDLNDLSEFVKRK